MIKHDPEKGAKKVLSEAARLGKKDNLLIVATDSLRPIVDYFVLASKSIGTNLMLVQIPEPMRPIRSFSDMMARAVSEADAVVYIADRRPEELPFIYPLMNTCKENQCRFILMYGVKLSYLQEGGIFANYKLVEKRGKRIERILKDAENVEVTSKIGTSIAFKLHNHIESRSPIFTPEVFVTQAPEGEVMTCPLENSFTGRIVVDGAITGMGIPRTPITMTFKKGRITELEGNKEFLSRLIGYANRFDKTTKTLIGTWIGEFAIGTNDRANFDNNVANSEKVAGTVHFGIGRSMAPTGKSAKSRLHIDCVLKKPQVVVTTKSGKKILVIENGNLLIL